ncbi:redoxin domain-containing protein [Paenibacillus sp. FSL R5-0407]|uniref:TlpA family protein disulfide reductase n=1 Tax=Paenibacillus sp. FSL R5-0407 TaxID=2975320 RepID=UPI0030F6280C
MKMKINFRFGLTFFIGLFALLAVIWVVVSTSQKNEDKASTERLSIGATAPDFQATNTLGEKVTLSDFRGKSVVINFWASWCGPCVNEMPLINRVFQDSDSDVVTLFVNVGESKGTVNEFLTQHQFDFPVIIDVTGKISGMYAVTGLPVTYILEKEGNIAHSIIGEISSENQLYNYLETAKED